MALDRVAQGLYPDGSKLVLSTLAAELREARETAGISPRSSIGRGAKEGGGGIGSMLKS